MITGDNSNAAHYIAQQAGIHEVYADLLPEQKLELIKKLGLQGKVAMVGDMLDALFTQVLDGCGRFSKARRKSATAM